MATIPDEPHTDVEQYLNRIATGSGEIPDEPHTNVEQYLAAIVENGTGGGGSEARVVSELPEEGETGYIYLVLKEQSSSGDIYDEWVWALQQDGTTYGWEHIGATNEVTITLYDSTGQNTDGAMTQKATTDALKKMGTPTFFTSDLQTKGLITYNSSVRRFEMDYWSFLLSEFGLTKQQALDNMPFISFTIFHDYIEPTYPYPDQTLLYILGDGLNGGNGMFSLGCAYNIATTFFITRNKKNDYSSGSLNAYGFSAIIFTQHSSNDVSQIYAGRSGNHSRAAIEKYTSIDSLASSDSERPLAAKQGKTLNESKLAVANLLEGNNVTLTRAGSGANQTITIDVDGSSVDTITNEDWSALWQ